MSKWVWVDLELTGLDLEKDTILEIAVIITDRSCQNRVQGPHLILHASDEVLNFMQEAVVKLLSSSTLLEEVRSSSITLEEAEALVFDFLESQGVSEGLLSGNSVHMDWLFLLKCMPRLFERHLSKTRILDISSVKEVYNTWFNSSPPPTKQMKHRSLDDINESIKELEFYLVHLFNHQI